MLVLLLLMYYVGLQLHSCSNVAPIVIEKADNVVLKLARQWGKSWRA